MAYDWFPFSVADYRRDTKHLTAEQDGIYRRLIDEYMFERQPLIDNDVALARIAGVSLDSWGIAAAILRPYFFVENGRLRHKRCDEELRKQDEYAKIASEKGKKGAKKRWGKDNKKQRVNGPGIATAIATAIAPAMPHQTLSSLKKEKKDTPLPPKTVDNSKPLPGVGAVPDGKGGSQGWKGRIELHLKDGDIEAARKEAPGWDIYHLMRVYDEGVATRGAPSNPPAAFLGWLPSYTKRKPPD